MSTTWYRRLSTAFISSSFVISLFMEFAGESKSLNCFGGGRAISSHIFVCVNSQPGIINES